MISTQGDHNSMEEQIGWRVRKLRLERGFTTTALAERAGITQGYLSKIENSKKAPPVSTLMNIARALGISISDILSETDPETRVTVTRENERQVLARSGLEFGYSYEPLAPLYPNRHMDPHILTAIPANKDTRIVQHKGEEMFFVLEGSVLFKYENDEYRLDKGDCLYWDAGVPHSARALGDVDAKVLVVIYNGE